MGRWPALQKGRPTIRSALSKVGLGVGWGLEPPPPPVPSQGCGDPQSQPPLKCGARKQWADPAPGEVTALSGRSPGSVAHTRQGLDRDSALLAPAGGCRQLGLPVYLTSGDLHRTQVQEEPC